MVAAFNDAALADCFFEASSWVDESRTGSRSAEIFIAAELMISGSEIVGPSRLSFFGDGGAKAMRLLL